MDYVLIWAGLMAFAVFAYVVLDGFDLGIGLLFPFLRSESDKATAMNSIAPFWDGNETWLVLGGGGLYATFPLAFAIIMPALYAPLILMLLALIFRGVAFEFRWRTATAAGRRRWDLGFIVGSVVAAFTQGIALGALVQGVHVVDRAYAGGWWDWLTPFSVLTGVAVVVGYALLGACWLIYKTEDDLQRFCRRLAFGLAWALGAMILAVSVWMLFIQDPYMKRWFTYPNFWYLSPVPVLAVVVGLALLKAIRNGGELSPFLLTIAWFGLSYFGLCISFYPQIVPPDINLWQAASPVGSLQFLLVGAAILIPIILAYTAYSYWVFRGKVNPDENYH
ncbi:cytochrome d ubiquinol oxidase subunit II [Marinicella meishanensis]|uniref:cytochrome d ubiquinol oxidase subunit II n=1 Tax=Marinicella meishanensis TaxID=2873263 RepID=UPI001CBFE2AB|nr:cytochrome d ubiquinol oxidase subunit II [Marinicella sp. NBU2979]